MQYSLFGKRPLFDEITLGRRRTEWRQSPISGLEEAYSSLANFCRELRNANVRSLKETTLEQSFNPAFFVSLLGYQLFPGQNDNWTAWPKPPAHATGLAGEPDLLLGNFGSDNFDCLAVVELKKPGTSLDAPQPSYNNKTPVEQAFTYGRSIATCRWIIVSDMQFVRLYSIETQDSYHEIDLWSRDLASENDIIVEAFNLFGFENLAKYGDDSPTARLLASVREEQAAFRDGFYKIYSDIRSDLLEYIGSWSAGRYDRGSQVLAVQRLLDRLLFIFFCEDHPDRLLQRGLLENIVRAAVHQPGPSTSKAYDSIKQLFRDLDKGVSTDFISVPRYNGELFKPHPIVDSLTIDDRLHAKNYRWSAHKDNTSRVVNGVFGLHIFDFWRELDRDLLGNLFERSIGDLAALAHGGRPDARKAFGVFYTASRLAKFVAKSAVEASLADNLELSSALSEVTKTAERDRAPAIERVFNLVSQYRIADLACGSGVFLTASFDALLSPYRKALEAVRTGDMTREFYGFRQSELLKQCIFGIDLLPQAVELAKLSLWLTAARRNEPSAELSGNFLTGDSLRKDLIDQLVSNAGSQFDLIVGNPPWGAEYNLNHAAKVLESVGLADHEQLDSWEVFLGLVMGALKPGGRFALLIPETIFSADKQRSRRWLLNCANLEKVYSLGADWFTSDVRMGTVIIQGTKQAPKSGNRISTFVLAGRERLEAQAGTRPLEQLEQVARQGALQDNFRKDSENQIQVLASDDEINLIRRVEAASVPISRITQHARGDEINADGIIWRCGNCGTFTVPGEKIKGGGLKDKACPNCSAKITAADAFPEPLIAETRSNVYSVPYIDGGALTRRYEHPTRRYIRTDISNLIPPLKSSSLFAGPKIFIRQAGVGIVATIASDDCRCPQSVYIYRVDPEAAALGYSNEFILGCLVSRTMNYFCMKRFSEIDPAKAFAKLTHARIANFPIPRIENAADRREAREISALVNQMLQSPNYGGEVDFEIETRLRIMWRISSDEGRFINGFFSILPEGQAVRDLFPLGAPPRIKFPR